MSASVRDVGSRCFPSRSSRSSGPVGPGSPAHVGAQPPQSADYYVYVGAESADLLHRIRFGPEGATLDRTIAVGEMATETEGPHGLNISPDGPLPLHDHGPRRARRQALEVPRRARHPRRATRFSWGTSPQRSTSRRTGSTRSSPTSTCTARWFPSTISVVYTPDMIEVDQIETCTMPHGARLDASAATFLYSACMMDDQIVEVDTRTFEVSRAASRWLRVARVRCRLRRRTMSRGSTSATLAAACAATCSPTWVVPASRGPSLYVACNRGRPHPGDRPPAPGRSPRAFETGTGPYNLALTPDDACPRSPLSRQGAASGVHRHSHTGRSAAHDALRPPP